MADPAGMIATIGMSAGSHHGENMEQIMCMVSKEAKDVLRDWQKNNGFSKQGDAMENLLLEFQKNTDEG